MGKENFANSLISIIVPVYNVEKYVKKCILSLIRQTYARLEIILVDDGSTDRSGKICDYYAKRDKRITVWHKTNGGLSDARNYGIERAHGLFLGFVDGDDWIHPQMYETMIIKLLETDADIACCDYTQKAVRKFKRKVDIDKLNLTLFSKAEALNNIGTILVIAWNKLYRKKLFDNIRYPLNRYHEDEFIIHHLLSQCSKVTVIDKKLYFYVARAGSIVSEITEKHVYDALDAFNDRLSFCVEERFDDAISLVARSCCYYCIEKYNSIIKGEIRVRQQCKVRLLLEVDSMLEKYPDIVDEKISNFVKMNSSV